MDNLPISRRQVLGLLPAAALVMQNAVAAQDERIAPSRQVEPRDGTEPVGRVRFHELPPLPGRIVSEAFSPEGNQLALAISVRDQPGIVILVVDVPDGKEYGTWAELPDAIEVFSLAWSPYMGGALLFSVRVHVRNDPKPFQTRLYQLHAGRKEAQQVAVISAEVTPIDKNGRSLRFGWLSPKLLLAVQEDDMSLYELDPATGGLNPVIDLRNVGVTLETTARAPVRIQDGEVGVPLVTVTREPVEQDQPDPRSVPRPRTKLRFLVFGEAGRQIRSYDLDEIPYGGVRLVFSGRAYYRRYRGQEQPNAVVEEVLRIADSRLIATLPSKSPFAAADATDTRRIGIAMSEDGRRLALIEVDDLPATRAKSRLHPQAGPGRLVVAEIV